MTTTQNVTVADIEFHAVDLDIDKAAAAYKAHGCLVVRGLMKPHIKTISEHIAARLAETIALLDQCEKIDVGWRVPNGALAISAPDNYDRDKQVMTLGLSYKHSGAFLQSAFEPKLLDLAEAVLGPDIELYGAGQCLVKEPVGGHPKNLHQDGSYFTHKYEGPMGVLTYVVDTNVNNGALHVVPGSHRLGLLEHEDTFSHLGLNEKDWPWEKSLPIEGEAGDAIIFHVLTIHGSKPNWSDQPRPVFIHRYRAAHDYVVISGPTVAARKKAAANADDVRKENQLGLMVRGSRRHEPERFA